ncbi:UNVERIFIED_CONTAM: Non-specific phospholipase C2 [Sesamum radiatum]|uniref:Non-specific phospholipase C2 n=1 Tax=Sesamum radiatum TaxID=300843 RepID=A0AAW2W233_SESRA
MVLIPTSVRSVVRLRAGFHAAQPPLRPLRHLARRHLQCGGAAGQGLPTAHHLRGSCRRRNILRNILPEHSGDAVLQRPEEAQVRRKLPPYGVSFKKDAKNGKLPGYVVVEQRYMDSKVEPANDDHPSHDVYQGQMFVKEVYETLRGSPQWNETLLVITYDEHGGFYDHVPTPNHGVPSPDGIVGPDPFFFKFDRLGVRVPTIVISPWIQKATVVHGPNVSPSPTSEYEHSSIPATVRKIFNLSSPPLTKREAWAGTFDGILQILKQPRTDCPEILPTPVKIRQGDANEEATVSEFQQELIQLAAVLKGDDLLTSYPGKIGKNMSVREGKEYMESAVKSFFEAGFAAKKLGVDEQQIVKMRPSLSTRP